MFDVLCFVCVLKVLDDVCFFIMYLLCVIM
jgi:hypothetical protein